MTRFLATAVAILLAGTAQAQTATSNSNTQSHATSAAQNAGNAQSITFNSDASGRQTIKSAPNMGSQGFYGSFSGDSCMVSAGGGVSIVGVGVQGASPVRDEQCAILRGFERIMQAGVTIGQSNPVLGAKLQQAAIDSLCNLNETVGTALRHQGVCSRSEAPQLATAQPTDSWGFSARVEP